MDESVFEPRQPQDLVRGVKDNQTVPDARPLSPPQFTGPIYQQMSQAAGIGATHIYLEALAGFTVGNKVGVMMDNGIEWPARLVSIDPSGAFITITPGLPYTAAANNLAVDYRIAA